MQEANLKLFCRWVCCCWVYPHCLFSSLVSCKRSLSATKVLLVQCCVRSAGIFVGLRTGPGCCWSVHGASAKDSGLFVAEVLRIHGVLLCLGMCVTHGPCHCNWATLLGMLRLRALLHQWAWLAINGCTNGFGIHEKWPLPRISLPFLTAPKPNAAVLAISLFGTEVGRSADEWSRPIAQRKPLNAAKNTERGQEYGTPKNTERYQEYGTQILRLSSIII